jgi:hypothetical protein
LGSPVQDTTHGGAADIETAGDFRFADSGPAQFADLIGVQSRGCGPAQTLAVLPGMSQSGAHAFPQYLSFELGEDGQPPPQLKLTGRF